jgi:hypothetical protein
MGSNRKSNHAPNRDKQVKTIRNHETMSWMPDLSMKFDEEEPGEELDEPKWTTLRLRTYI